VLPCMRKRRDLQLKTKRSLLRNSIEWLECMQKRRDLQLETRRSTFKLVAEQKLPCQQPEGGPNQSQSLFKW
jgi:hypothetical protein